MITGCTPTTQVVLLPDPDGHVGVVELSNEGGETVIDQKYQSIEVSSQKKMSHETKTIPADEVQEIFADAISVSPKIPESHLLYFYIESTKLKPSSTQALKKAIEEILSRQAYEVGVIGHTDRSGSQAYNRTLSLRRANKVMKLLIDAGVKKEAIEMSYHGEEDPLIPTKDGAMEPRNRRVEIVIR